MRLDFVKKLEEMFRIEIEYLPTEKEFKELVNNQKKKEIVKNNLNTEDQMEVVKEEEKDNNSKKALLNKALLNKEYTQEISAELKLDIKARNFFQIKIKLKSKDPLKYIKCGNYQFKIFLKDEIIKAGSIIVEDFDFKERISEFKKSIQKSPGIIQRNF